ncbi:MAG: lysylphosphatidylglycerol synthase transmembrane domain-containing protein [Victivallaceae bacterium]|nr:lysylphosphatidylglycerol synthase transmembrane domain-containing protein [Victivallaceae bacterium]
MSDISISAAGRPAFKFRKLLWLVLKFGLAGGIIWYLIASHAADFQTALHNFNYYFLIPAGIAYFSHMVVCGWRWYLLAKVIGVPLSLPEAVAVTMQGYFWSLAIPGGAIGGDFARVAIIAKRVPKGGKAEGVLSILMDRIVGMVALFVLTILLVAVSIPQLMNVSINGVELSFGLKIAGIIGLVGMCLAGIAAMLVLFFHNSLRRITICDRLFVWGDARSHGMISRMTAAIDLYAKDWKLLAFLTVVSVFLIHLMTVVAVAFLVCGVGDGRLPVLAVITAVTIGNIVGLLPLTVSGLGLRDATILILLKAGNMSDETAATVPIMYSCLILAFNIFAALFFVFDGGGKRERA